MTIYYGPQCTCGVWQSILPPPVCPVHGHAQWIYTPPNSSLVTWKFSTQTCSGRHCAHDAQCAGYMVNN